MPPKLRLCTPSFEASHGPDGQATALEQCSGQMIMTAAAKTYQLMVMLSMVTLAMLPDHDDRCTSTLSQNAPGRLRARMSHE